jgi:hypothetical protein
VDIHPLLLVGLDPTIPVFGTHAQWTLYAVNNDRRYFELSPPRLFRSWGFVEKIKAVCCCSEMSVWAYNVASCHRSEDHGQKMFIEKYIQVNGFSGPL